MKKFWISQRCLMVALTVCCLYLLNLSFCCSLNHEGWALLRFKERVLSDPYGALSDWNNEVGVENPCSWFGVGCFEGYVVNLELKNLCLQGTLTPDIVNMVHVKSIVLRNNSFFGLIPKEILDLEELEIVDLEYNNFSGPLPHKLYDSKQTRIILLDNNEHLDRSYRRNYELQKLSNDCLEENKSYCNSLLIPWHSGDLEDVSRRKLLQEGSAHKSVQPPPPVDITDMHPRPPNSQGPTNLGSTPKPEQPPVPAPDPSPGPNAQSSLSPPDRHVPPPLSSTPLAKRKQKDKDLLIRIVIPTIVAFTFLLVIGYFLLRSWKMTTVKPWAAGLSGQLQRAFVTGVPKLKRSELVAACEDFSNVIIGSSSFFKLYKGTLSSGCEIAVASFGGTTSKDWSNSKEAQFWKKINTLSKVNHKNFICLLGYCVEKEPFTRMLVFEYAPNGTLFEHLHVREAEHLNWEMRLRIAVGIAYCLEHMHQLDPPLVHSNLTASSVYLTEDYAGKVADFTFDEKEADVERTMQSNVYSFGVILFEMVTGRLPYSVGGESVEYWASDYLEAQPLREIIDPSLQTYHEGQLYLIGNVINLCTNSDPMKRPTIKEVCTRLREIAGIGLDGALPKLSPNRWAELEILSNEAS